MNVKRTYATMQAEFTDEIHRLAELAFRRYCRNVCEPLYLCGSRFADNPAIWERFSIASESEIDARPELSYVRPEPLSRAITLENLQSIIREVLRHEPQAIFADYPYVRS